MTDLITTAELAKRTGLAVTTIRDRIHRGLLKPTIPGTNNTPHLFNPNTVSQLQQIKGRKRVIPIHQGEHCGTCALFGHRSAGDACYEFNEWVNGDYPACGRWMPDAWRLRRVG